MREILQEVLEATDVFAAAVAAATWLGLYGLVRLATRSWPVAAGPPTSELGDEPPAVVSLIANRWRVTSDAVSGTWLDLAHRGYVELDQPRGRPATATTVRLTGSGGGDVTSYERRLLDRLRAFARSGPVTMPVLGLAFRRRRQARLWYRAFATDVAADARRRGLSRRRFGGLAIAVLLAGAVGAGVLMAGTTQALEESPGAVWVEGLGLTLALAAAGLRYPGERHTATGRAAAAHWLGVGGWLRSSTSLSYQPPAAVGPWGRHLAYATALGVARVAGSVLDPGIGGLRVVASGYGGVWRRVRVRIPRGWPRYGVTPGRMVARSVGRLAGGSALIALAAWASGAPSDASPVAPLLVELPLLAGVLLVGLGLYTLVRSLIDLAAPTAATGEVLWVTELLHDGQGEAMTRIAVDAGKGDRTVAWLVPKAAVAGVGDGDIVRFVGYRWTRRVRHLELVWHRPRPQEQIVEEIDPDVVMAAAGDRVAGAAVRTARWVDRLGRWLDADVKAPVRTVALARHLTAGEVGSALGLAVDGPEAVGGMVYFRARDTRRTVLMVAGYAGKALRRLARSRTGRALPGVGDAARLRRNGGWVRVGDTVVVVTLLHEGLASRAGVPRLLTEIALRLGRDR